MKAIKSNVSIVKIYMSPTHDYAKSGKGLIILNVALSYDHLAVAQYIVSLYCIFNHIKWDFWQIMLVDHNSVFPIASYQTFHTLYT